MNTDRGSEPATSRPRRSNQDDLFGPTLTIDQAAAVCGLDTDAVAIAIQDGRIPNVFHDLDDRALVPVLSLFESGLMERPSPARRKRGLGFGRLSHAEAETEARIDNLREQLDVALLRLAELERRAALTERLLARQQEVIDGLTNTPSPAPAVTPTLFAPRRVASH